MMRAVWTLVDEDESATLGRMGSLGVAILRAPLDVRFFDRVGGVMEALALEDGFSMLIVRAGAVPGQMPGPARERAMALMREHADGLRAFGYVLGGGGLKARMLRGAMNAVLLGASFPAKTFTEVRPAVEWVLAQPGQPVALRAEGGAIARQIESLVP